MGSKIEGGTHLWGHFPGMLRGMAKKQMSPWGYARLSAALPHSSGRGSPSDIAVLKTRIGHPDKGPSCYFSDNRCRVPWILDHHRGMLSR